MALNPFREALGQAGLLAYHHESSFKAEADATLARFQSLRDDLERQVRRGDLTLKVARERSVAAAEELRRALLKRAENFSPVPRAFLDRLVEASDARKRARDHMSLEGLQRETNRLLRQSLTEQQIDTRAGEFEGKTYVRSLTGGPPSPTLDSLLAFQQTAIHAGDEAAMEWGRRQLEAFRGRVLSPEDQRRIDLATERPDLVNPHVVETYVDSLQETDPEGLETFTHQAIESRDANACMAAFLIARSNPDETRPRWVRIVLGNLSNFPDAALNTLRTLEAESRSADAEAARTQAEFAIAVAESQVRFSGVEPPTDVELNRQARAQSRPVAQIGEPIGLALDRRGATPDEYTSLFRLAPEN